MAIRTTTIKILILNYCNDNLTVKKGTKTEKEKKTKDIPLEVCLIQELESHRRCLGFRYPP